jgi:small-conductance mechanosensitive channel
MTTTQKTLLGAVLVAASAFGIYEAQQNARLKEKLQAQEQTRVSLDEQVAELTAENERHSNQLVHAGTPNEAPKIQSGELLRLRGLANLNSRQIDELKAALAQGQNIPDSIGTILNRYFDGYRTDEKQRQNNRARNELQSIAAKLSLTPEQVQQVHQILQNSVEARTELEVAAYNGSISSQEFRAGRSKFDADESAALAGVLSSDQMSTYEQARSEEADSVYMDWAQAMVAQLKGPFNLNPAQEQQVASVLFSLKPGEGGKNIPYYDNAQEQIEMRMRALESILSPEQLQGYRQKLLADTEEHNSIATVTKALNRSKP